MHAPSLYSETCNNQREGVRRCLKHGIGLMKWSANDLVMDIGCGPGNITIDTLMPVLPKDIKSVYAVDISSEMVAHAELYNRNEKVEYCLMDIGAADAVSERIKGNIDHAFSFYCFHWISDQRQLYKNLYDMLKPGGDFLSIFIQDSVIHNSWHKLKVSDKWSKNLEKVELIMNNTNCKQYMETIKPVLDELGISYMISIQERTYIYSNYETFRDYVQSLTSILKFIPQNLHNEFMDDLMNAICNGRTQRVGDVENQHKIEFLVEEIMIYGRKNEI